MIEILFLVEEDPEGGWMARAVGESIVTQGDNLDEVEAAVKDAVLCHFDDGMAPRLIRLHIVREQLIAV